MQLGKQVVGGGFFLHPFGHSSFSAPQLEHLLLFAILKSPVQAPKQRGELKDTPYLVVLCVFGGDSLEVPTLPLPPHPCIRAYTRGQDTHIGSSCLGGVAGTCPGQFPLGPPLFAPSPVPPTLGAHVFFICGWREHWAGREYRAPFLPQKINTSVPNCQGDGQGGS